jgi:hypothetical protein
LTRASAPLSRNDRRAEPGTHQVNNPAAATPASPPNRPESRFNTAILFDLPAQVGTPHFVSHVVPGVPGRRLAISGWYG